MLKQLSIKNFLFIREVLLDFSDGLVVFTGETGAGKSIVMDALGICLGDRIEQGMMRNGASQLEIIATFNISSCPTSVARYLIELDLLEDEHDECYLRRSLKLGQSSKCFINNRPTTLQQMKQLGEKLLEMHGQGEHQKLLLGKHQRSILDEYAQSSDLSQEVSNIASSYHEISAQIQEIEKRLDFDKSRMDAVAYQVEELEGIDLSERAISSAQQEHTMLLNTQDNQELLATMQTYLSISSNESPSVHDLLLASMKSLHQIKGADKQRQEIEDALQKVIVELDEVNSLLQDFSSRLEADPQRLNELEDLVGKLTKLARKHHVDISDLFEIYERLSSELDSLKNSDDNLDAMRGQREDLKRKYLEKSSELSKKRKSGATLLSKEVTSSLGSLKIQGMSFIASLNNLATGIHTSGQESVEFCIQHVGQEPVSMKKAASGGELSRISLAIQVVLSGKTAMNTLVFDEVDVGIGGAVTEIVGDFLVQLSEHSQVLSITHQAQIVAKAKQHFLVNKVVEGETIQTQLKELNQNEREEEIARMIGGVEIDEATRQHARSMLRTKNSKKSAK